METAGQYAVIRNIDELEIRYQSRPHAHFSIDGEHSH